MWSPYVVTYSLPHHDTHTPTQTHTHVLFNNFQITFYSKIWRSNFQYWTKNVNINVSSSRTVCGNNLIHERIPYYSTWKDYLHSRSTCILLQTSTFVRTLLRYLIERWFRFLLSPKLKRTLRTVKIRAAPVENITIEVQTSSHRDKDLNVKCQWILTTQQWNYRSFWQQNILWVC